MAYQPLSDKHKEALVKLIMWWSSELIDQGKNTDSDKRLNWMIKIHNRNKYNDVEKNFLNQMREMKLGVKETKQKPESKPFRSTVNVNGFPMV